MSWLSDTWRERIRARVAVAQHEARKHEAAQDSKGADAPAPPKTVSVNAFRRPLRFPRPGDPDFEDTPHPDPERFRRAQAEPPRKCECAENGRVCATCRERKPWRNPLDELAEADDSGYSELDG